MIQCWLAIEDCNNLHLAPQKKWRVLNKTSEILEQRGEVIMFFLLVCFENRFTMLSSADLGAGS